MLRALGDGVIAAAKRAGGDLDSAAGTSFMRALGTGPEPTHVEPLMRLPKAAAEPEPAEEELRDVIAPGYFDQDFESVRHFLESLPPDTDEPGSSARFSQHMSAECARYESALDRVTHELSANVMANYGTFVSGMSQVSELGSDLVVTGIRCRAARRHLRAADESLSRTGLTLIGKLRRRAAMRTIAARLEGITDAVQAAKRLQALLAAELSERAPSAPALRLLLEACQLYGTCAAAKASAGDGSLLHRLSVVDQLGAVHARLLALLDDARRRLCAAFDLRVYAGVLECAVCLGGAAELAASTADAFAAAIGEQLSAAARRCIFEQLGIAPDAPSGSARAGASAGAARPAPQPGATLPATSADAAALASSIRQSATATQRQRVLSASLKELVGMLREERASGAFVALLRALADSLSAHHAMVCHHRQALADVDDAGADGAAPAGGADGRPRARPGGGAEAGPRAGAEVPREAHEALLRSLALGRGAVWVEMQRQLSAALVGLPTASFGLPELLRLLGSAELFMRLGHAFSGEPATVLRASVRTKAGSFYAAFHRERLDELRLRLEGELWQKLPPLTQHALAAALLSARPEGGGAAAERGAEPSAAGGSAGGSVGGSAGGSALFPASYAALEPLLRAEAAAMAKAAAAAGAPGSAAAAANGASSAQAGPARACASAGAAGGAEGGGPAEAEGLWERWARLRGLAEGAQPPEPSGEQPAQPAAALPTGDDGRPLAVSATALNLARMAGRYVLLMEALPLVSSDAFGGVASLFELFVLVLFTQFWGGPRVGSAGWDEGPLGEHLAPRLKGTLLRLHHTVVEPQTGAEPAPLSATALETAAALRKTAQRLVGVLHPPSQPGALSARLGPQEAICASDSLRFLVCALECARPRIEAQLSAAHVGSAASHLAHVASFFAQVVDAVPHLQELILRSLVRKTLDLSAACAAVVGHKWELREIGTSESAYVPLFVAAAQTAVTHISLLSVSPLTVARLHGMIGEMVAVALVEVRAARHAVACPRAPRAQPPRAPPRLRRATRPRASARRRAARRCRST